ncbi:MAG: MmcQ/YjbR family DNA-binding protein [Kineosporiaceae bacterium]
MATWEDVERVVATLPGVVEGTGHGGRVWKVRGHPVVWERPLRRADRAHLGDAAPPGPVLGVRAEDLDAKEAALAEMSGMFTTPHFDGYAVVLVDLDRVDPEDLAELVERAGRDAAAAPRRRSR